MTSFMTRRGVISLPILTDWQSQYFPRLSLQARRSFQLSEISFNISGGQIQLPTINVPEIVLFPSCLALILSITWSSSMLSMTIRRSEPRIRLYETNHQTGDSLSQFSLFLLRCLQTSVFRTSSSQHIGSLALPLKTFPNISPTLLLAFFLSSSSTQDNILCLNWARLLIHRFFSWH